jgi:superfamily I DNA/RNA helicase
LTGLPSKVDFVADIDDLVAAPPEAHGVVIAGPGAGKTFNIGRRVDSLREQGLEASEIVLLTLTNATARTLRDRFPAVPVRTLHAYALTALDKLGAAVGKRVADTWEQRELVRRDIQRLTPAGRTLLLRHHD